MQHTFRPATPPFLTRATTSEMAAVRSASSAEMDSLFMRARTVLVSSVLTAARTTRREYSVVTFLLRFDVQSVYDQVHHSTKNLFKVPQRCWDAKTPQAGRQAVTLSGSLQPHDSAQMKTETLKYKAGMHRGYQRNKHWAGAESTGRVHEALPRSLRRAMSAKV